MHSPEINCWVISDSDEYWRSSVMFISGECLITEAFSSFRKENNNGTKEND